MSRILDEYHAEGVRIFASCTTCPAGEESGVLANLDDEEAHQAPVGFVWPDRWTCLDCGSPLVFGPHLDTYLELLRLVPETQRRSW